MPGPTNETDIGVDTGPDLHLQKRAVNSPFDFTPTPAGTLFGAPDAMVRKTPMALAVPMPARTEQYHGSESVPYQEFVSEQTLNNLTKGGKRFFRALLEPAVKHV